MSSEETKPGIGRFLHVTYLAPILTTVIASAITGAFALRFAMNREPNHPLPPVVVSHPAPAPVPAYSYKAPDGTTVNYDGVGYMKFEHRYIYGTDRGEGVSALPSAPPVPALED